MITDYPGQTVTVGGDDIYSNWVAGRTSYSGNEITAIYADEFVTIKKYDPPAPEPIRNRKERRAFEAKRRKNSRLGQDGKALPW